MRDAQRWIRELGLEPHPEGGHYRETYRAGSSIGECCLGEGFSGPRPVSTAIYYLLQGEEFSALHRIRSDEIWHFYAGVSLTLHLLLPGPREYHGVRLGVDGEARPQVVVPAGAWFGARVDAREGFSLVGCTVAPGFDFRDFELGRREDLSREFPGQRAIIEALIR